MSSEINESDIQVVRLLLMMYRQGWIDANEHLAIESMRRTRELFKQYKDLLPKSE